MKKIQLPLLFCTLALTACNQDSTTDKQQESPVIQAPVVQAPQTAPVKTVLEQTSPATDFFTIDSSVQQPSQLKISSKGDNVQLSWGYVAGASSYNIYYSDSTDVDDNSIRFTTSNTRFTHNGLSTSIHNYKVQAVFAEQERLSTLSRMLQADLNQQVTIED